MAVERVEEPEREKEGVESNGSVSSASGEEAVVVTKFKDSRWVGGTWDLKQFQKDGTTEWDAVIDAGELILPLFLGLFALVYLIRASLLFSFSYD